MLNLAEIGDGSGGCHQLLFSSAVERMKFASGTLPPDYVVVTEVGGINGGVRLLGHR